MIRQVTNINWGYIGDAVPSFVTLALMPFTYSVAYGLIASVLSSNLVMFPLTPSQWYDGLYCTEHHDLVRRVLQRWQGHPFQLA